MTTAPLAPTSQRRFTGWAWLAALGVALGLVVAPTNCNEFDVVRCSFPWAVATGGLRPWAAYHIDLCIYPPVVLYVLTVVRAVERVLGMPVDGAAGVVAVKVPCLLAYAAGAWACAVGLAPAWGRRAAARAAVAYAVCLPVWYDAAVWGQWDAILTLAIVAAVVAAVRDRPAWAGAAVGVGLAVKLQAVVVVPPLAVYGWRRWGGLGVCRGIGGTTVGWAAAVLPMLLGGHLGWFGVRRAYSAPVDFYQFRTAVAANVWMVTETATATARQWPNTFGHTDAQRLLGPLTIKQAGLGLFATYTAAVLAGLWRRPTRRQLVSAAALVAFGFFMLPTQMHERYVMPACALLAVAVGATGRWRGYVAVMLLALANQVIALRYENGTTGRPRVTMADIAPYQPWLLAVSVGNVAALVAVTAAFLRASGKAATNGTNEHESEWRREAVSPQVNVDGRG